MALSARGPQHHAALRIDVADGGASWAKHRFETAAPDCGRRVGRRENPTPVAEALSDHAIGRMTQIAARAPRHGKRIVSTIMMVRPRSAAKPRSSVAGDRCRHPSPLKLGPTEQTRVLALPVPHPRIGAAVRRACRLNARIRRPS